MATAVLAVTFAIPATTPRIAVLLIKIVTGAAFYGASLWFLFRDRVLALVRATTQLRGDAPAPAPAS
jgi:hypothetical protein